MKIALDAMGGDNGAAVNVEGAVAAAREFGYEVALVGKQDQLRPILNQQHTAGLTIPIVHASEVVEMHEHPAQAVKAKKDSSMVVAMNMVKRGEADAFVTMGNTGGALAAALFNLGRIKGIHRPALSAQIPTLKGWSMLMDVGANAEVKPEYLAQFALMGSIYAERVLGKRNPAVALISNGEEDTKGTTLVQEANQMIRKLPINFIGNAEGRHIPAGEADVFITDGFTGNVMLKLMEGMQTFFKTLLKDTAMRDTRSKLGGLLMRPGINATMNGLNYEEVGGAPLLGVDGVVVIGHGRSKARAVRSAIHVAAQYVQKQVVDTIEKGLAALPADLGI